MSPLMISVPFRFKEKKEIEVYSDSFPRAESISVLISTLDFQGVLKVREL